MSGRREQDDSRGRARDAERQDLLRNVAPHRRDMVERANWVHGHLHEHPGLIAKAKAIRTLLADPDYSPAAMRQLGRELRATKIWKHHEPWADVMIAIRELLTVVRDYLKEQHDQEGQP